jgi:hypothetical protein
MEGNSEMKFLNTKRHTNTLRGALDGAIRHLQKEFLNELTKRSAGVSDPNPLWILRSESAEMQPTLNNSPTNPSLPFPMKWATA